MIETVIGLGVKAVLAHAHAAAVAHATASGSSTLLSGHATAAAAAANLAPHGAAVVHHAGTTLPVTSVIGTTHAAAAAAGSHTAHALSSTASLTTVTGSSNAPASLGSALEMLGLIGAGATAGQVWGTLTEAGHELSQGNADGARRLAQRAWEEGRPLRSLVAWKQLARSVLAEHLPENDSIR